MPRLRPARPLAAPLALSRWALGVLGLCALPAGSAALGGTAGEAFGLQPLPARAVELEQGAWRARIVTLQTALLPGLHARFEREGALANFDAAARHGGDAPEHNGDREADAEVYRWIEAVALSLHTRPDERLRAQAGAVVERILAAQEQDGYLVTWYQVLRPERRFRDLRQSLELYSIAHLIRAGLAWRAATGETGLYDAGLRAATLVKQRFGPGKLLDPPGFSAIEEALVQLADATGDESFADLALFFIEQRGDQQRRKRYGPAYQDDLPVLSERLAVGHAERGLALYAAIAEVARTRGYADYWGAAQTIWDDIVQHKLYVTGGVGDSLHDEGFGPANELPLATAFCATGAAASMLELNQSLLLRTGHAVGAEFVELELYNALLAGMSPDGKRFFHDNPLLSLGGTARVERPVTTRPITALARSIAGVGGLIYAHTESDLYLAQYIASSATVPLAGARVRLRMQTDYPASGKVRVTVDPPGLLAFTLRVRVPGWCSEPVTLGVNGVLRDVRVTHGHDKGTWLEFERKWGPGDVVEIEFPMVARIVEPDPRVEQRAGLVALRRGPELYCVEAVDNAGSVFDLYLPRSAALSTRHEPELLGGVQVVEAVGGRLAVGGAGAALRPATIRAVPYRLWGNREPGAMAVWLAASPERAVLPGASGAVYEGGYLVQASHTSRHTSLRAACEGLLPRDSRDRLLPRATFEQHRGGQEWLRYDFESTRMLSGSAVYWFDEGPGGACRVPRAWRLQWLQGESWHDVELVDSSYGTLPDRMNRVTFRRVATPALRLVVELQPEASGGVLEWTVESPNEQENR